MAKGSDVKKDGQAQRAVAAHETLQVENWKKWACNDEMPEPYISNIRSWSQPQVLAMAIQIHQEMANAAPDPQQYPETVNVAKQLLAGAKQEKGKSWEDYGYGCISQHRYHLQKVVVNFYPEELEGRSWQQFRRSKGPLRFW